MALAARQAPTDYLLFTDADVLFHPASIRLTLANAVATNADHLVLVPTNIIKRWDEAAILGFFQIFCLWAARPWRIADPKAKRDAIGLGAFNLLRRSAYIEIGGYESLRMEIIEDLGLGRRIKRAGLAQRITFGRGLVSLHWASGAPGLVSVMTKNLFAAFRFYISLALLWCLWLLTFWVAPAIGLFFGLHSSPCRDHPHRSRLRISFTWPSLRHLHLERPLLPLQRTRLHLRPFTLHARHNQTRRHHLARHLLPTI